MHFGDVSLIFFVAGVQLGLWRSPRPPLVAGISEPGRNSFEAVDCIKVGRDEAQPYIGFSRARPVLAFHRMRAQCDAITNVMTAIWQAVNFQTTCQTDG